VIDLHTHVLPGVDDGCRTLAQSVELVGVAAAAGVSALAATPHVSSDYPTDAATMERLVRAVREAVAAAAISVEILPGGELDLVSLDRPADELRRFGLGGNPQLLLVEVPYAGWPLALEERLFRLQAAGFRPVLAHPERNPEVQARPELLEGPVARGVLTQVTAASLDGRLGQRARRAGVELVERGLAHLVASDAHGPEVRAAGLDGAVRALGGGDLARWLTEAVPAALLAGEPLPERPGGGSRRVRPRLRWRPRRG
jgi:protein-tyrosine phosphatase